MRSLKTFAVLLAVLAAALAGCSGKKDGGDGHDGTPTSTPTGGTGSTPAPTPSATPRPTPSTPPPVRTATLEADVDSGVAPLNVTFTLDASGSAAASGWELAFGDQFDAETGTILPAEVGHTYDIAGNFTATLTVSYGDGSEATANVTLRVSAPAGGAAPADVRHDLDGTLPLMFPAGAGGVVGAPVDPTAFCDVVAFGRDADLNGTYLEYYVLNVQAGAKRVYIEGGGADPAGVGVPDFDVVIARPNGTCEVGGSEGSYEHLAVANPAPGEYVAAILHWAGTPADAYTGFIEVNY